MADTVAIAYPIPPTGAAENSVVRINLDAIVTAINNISNGLTNFNQLNVGTASTSNGIINWYNASNAFYYQIKPLAAPTASRIYSFADVGVDASFVLDAGAQSIAGSKTFTGNLAFQYTANNSSNLFQIINQSSGASAGAGIQLVVASGSTADPFVQFNNGSGLINWTIGLDNSASSFKISRSTSLGTNDAITIDNTGNTTINGTLSLSTVLAVNSGGTGQTSYTNGQLLIGNTTGNTLAKATLTGTSNQVVVTNGSGSITLSTPQSIDATATPTFASATLTATTNQLVLGTTRTITISAPTPATSSRVYSIPDAGKDTGFVTTDDTATMVGKTFASACTITPTTNQLVLGTTRTITISATQPAVSSRTWTIPDITGNGTFAALEGAQTFSGAKTFSATLTMSGATIAMGTQKITGLAAATTSGDALRYEQLLSGDVTLVGNLIFNPTTKGVKGTTTNDSPSAGNVGEIISSSITSPSNFGATGVYGDLTSISLTAGHWLIHAFIMPGNNAGTTFTQIDFGVSTTSGNSSTGLTQGDTAGFCTATAVPTSASIPVEVKLSGTVVHYLKYKADYSGSTPGARGKLLAVRVS